MLTQRSNAKRYWLLALAIPLLAPLFLGHFMLFLLVQMMIYGMIVASLQLLTGRAGLLSLGHAAFVGGGAYASAFVTMKWNLPFVAGLVVAILAGIVLALVIAPVLRLRQIYFAMATFAIGMMIHEVFVSWASFTGGHDGLPGIPPMTIFADLTGAVGSYYTILAALLLQYVLYRRFIHSPFGISLDAMRQNEAAAAATGIDLFAVKLRALLIAGGTAAAAGSLLAHTQGSVTPQLFNSSQSLNLLTMAVVGGIHSFAGAVVGPFIMRLALEYMRDWAQYTGLLYGVILAGFMVLLPRGVMGIFTAVWHWMASRRPAGSALPADEAATPVRKVAG